MKFFKKINLGLILAIITILAVIIYSVNVDNTRQKSKEDIKKACEGFIDITNKYAVLPEQYQVINQDAKTVNLNDYNSKIEEELNNAMVSEFATKIQKSILSDIVQNDLLNTSDINCSYDRKINKISSYEFDGNQVTVTFNSKLTVKQKYMDVNLESGEQSEKVREQTIEKMYETITLEQKDGSWKVVQANLDYSNIDAQNTNIVNSIM